MIRKLVAFHFAAALISTLLAFPMAVQAQEKKATPAELRKQLHARVVETIARLKKTDAGMDKFFKESTGYAVFPRIGKAGFIFGGGHGDAEVFDQGKAIGTASVTLGTIGLQAGVQEYSQIIFFQDRAQLDRFKQNKFEAAGNVSAVIVKSGAAVATKYNNGVAIFVVPTVGAMAEVAVGTQKFNFKPDQAAAKK